MKILIIKLGALGDIITSTAVIRRIREHHRTDDVYLLTTPLYKELFSDFDNLNIAAFERKGLLNTIKTIRWIRRHRFDRIYDLQSNDRTSLFCALSGSPFCAGNHPRYPYHRHPAKTYIGECHSFERLNQIIESADIKPAEALPYLPTPEKDRSDIAAWLAEHNLTKGSFVLLHAGSSPLHLTKRWPYFAELAAVISKSLSIVWIGGNDDIELNNILSKHVGINATNAFSILGLVELGRYAKFAVTNDSAPMHILSCSQIPVFGLFGPTYARRTHALGQFQNVITASKQIAKNDHDFKPIDISKITLNDALERLDDQKLI